jgi:hypothetical protein
MPAFLSRSSFPLNKVNFDAAGQVKAAVDRARLRYPPPPNAGGLRPAESSHDD